MNICIPGGMGYVGSWLVPHLLADGHKVKVIDTGWFGDGDMPDNDSLDVVPEDIREVDWSYELENQDCVIWLASLSNDLMCQLNPVLEKEINRDEFLEALEAAADVAVPRFVYASSVAAYGSSPEAATEATPLAPTTLYGAGKAFCEAKIAEHQNSSFAPIIVRSASVCGMSANMRFDITLNRMTHDACRYGRITVNGGQQRRSHVSLQDLAYFYKLLVKADHKKVAGQIFNVVDENQSVLDSANMVAEVTKTKVIVGPATDNRSYTVSGEKAKLVLGFEPKHPIKHAIHFLAARLDAGYWKNSLTDSRLWNMRYDIS